jgi:TetR/AcrR family transcriptional repressor of mexJK operon
MARTSTAARAKPRTGRPGWLPPVTDPRAEAILLAAFDLFMERGFERATMLEIATRAKVSKLTLYALFKDKEGLFEALVAWGCARYQIDAGARDEATDPVEAFEPWAVSLTRVMLRWQSMALFRIAVAQSGAHPRVAAIHHDLTRAGREATLAIMAARLAKAGFIDAADAGDFAQDFLALMRGQVFYDVLVGQTPPPAKADVERHVRRALGRLLKAYAPSLSVARTRMSGPTRLRSRTSAAARKPARDEKRRETT